MVILVWSKVQVICIWSSWCHCHPVISCIQCFNVVQFINIVELYFVKHIQHSLGLVRYCHCQLLRSHQETTLVTITVAYTWQISQKLGSHQKTKTLSAALFSKKNWLKLTNCENSGTITALVRAPELTWRVNIYVIVPFSGRFSNLKNTYMIKRITLSKCNNVCSYASQSLTVLL